MTAPPTTEKRAPCPGPSGFWNVASQTRKRDPRCASTQGGGLPELLALEDAALVDEALPLDDASPPDEEAPLPLAGPLDVAAPEPDDGEPSDDERAPLTEPLEAAALVEDGSALVAGELADEDAPPLDAPLAVSCPEDDWGAEGPDVSPNPGTGVEGHPHSSTTTERVAPARRGNHSIGGAPYWVWRETNTRSGQLRAT